MPARISGRNMLQDISAPVSRRGSVARERRVALGTRLGNRLAAAAEDALQLPARIRARRDDQPDQRADGAQQQPEGEPHLAPVALALREVGGRDRRRQPYVEQEERLGAEGGEDSHAPRYAFWTSGLSRRRSESSLRAMPPVSST